jgi:hypothetical protein
MVGIAARIKGCLFAGWRQGAVGHDVVVPVAEGPVRRKDSMLSPLKGYD